MRGLLAFCGPDNYLKKSFGLGAEYHCWVLPYRVATMEYTKNSIKSPIDKVSVVQQQLLEGIAFVVR